MRIYILRTPNILKKVTTKKYAPQETQNVVRIRQCISSCITYRRKNLPGRDQATFGVSGRPANSTPPYFSGPTCRHLFVASALIERRTRVAGHGIEYSCAPLRQTVCRPSRRMSTTSDQNVRGASLRCSDAQTPGAIAASRSADVLSPLKMRSATRSGKPTGSAAATVSIATGVASINRPISGSASAP